MVKKILLFLVVLPWLLWAFAPKKELYYLLEHRLAGQGIVLSGEALSATPVGLSIEHATLYAKGVRVATIEHISLWSLLLYTRGSAEHIRLDASLARMLPSAVQQVSVTHSVIQPMQIALRIDDPKLAATGTIDLSTRTIRLVFAKAPSAEMLTRKMKQTKEGWVYEQRF